METRANYVLVGSFVLLLLAGLAAFVLWFAKLQFDTEFARYDVHFTGTVTGLNEGSPVRFSGVRVGEAIEVRLDPDAPSQVIVTIEVDAGPVHVRPTPALLRNGLRANRADLDGLAFVREADWSALVREPDSLRGTGWKITYTTLIHNSPDYLSPSSLS